ncbi:response regulator [Paenibacillus paridis]|uniref:response regulator n=1 Tax=Paenibacillus paridis TaxID=2583376 RepID=UPI001390B40C|nr:response regulator [Paenibacillus paridis]
MYRLLIVDNEEYVVNGLVELFNPARHPEIEVAGAYSAAEALNVLMTTQMDIVITDIRMPGMNGLELQKIMVARWPYCKVIFLSGYDDFNYAQEAIRQGSVNYILKTEEDEVIVAAVYAAIKLVQGEQEAKTLLEDAKKQVKQALGALQREFFESLLLGDKVAYKSLPQQLDELQIPLLPEKQLFAVIAKVDEWEQPYSQYDRSLLLYAVQNIANEYLSLSMIHYSFIYDRSKIIWLMQSKAEPWIDHTQIASTMNMTSHFVYGTFECIQSSCRDLLNLSMSFAIGGHPFEWPQLGEHLDQLKNNMTSSIKKQQLVLDERQRSDQAGESRSFPDRLEIFKHYEHLAYCLEHKNKEEFHRVLELLLHIGEQAFHGRHTIVCLQISSSIYALLLAYLEKLNLAEMPVWISELQASLETGLASNWDWQMEQLQRLARYILEQCLPAEEHEENRVVQSIHAYLSSHLGGDLSLKTMAFAIGHNPSYLSRLYKQKAGKALSETINELKLARAKELLAEPQYRIGDVSKAVGFLSEHYFYRFFKKATQMTPQEYREQLQVNER